ncbi:tetratricopeptide repeat protein [Virgisporangium aliadipatigenens]|nr:tetratricopeptide repeat protein [Virgisporangium aliadipatigenens]
MSTAEWQARVDEVWANTPEADIVARIRSLVAELDPDDPVGPFELGGAYDGTDRPAEAIPLYERALAAGLAGERRRQAVIQLASSLRNVGRLSESVALLRAETARDEPLADEVRAFLALALLDSGRDREAVATALTALVPHLTMYGRALRDYVAELVAEPTVSPALAPLAPLVGTWRMRAEVDGAPVMVGVTTFGWLPGGTHLVQRAESIPAEDFTPPPAWIENSPMPTSSVIGIDDGTGAFTQLYADARGVHRVYAMGLSAGVWTLSRDQPGFAQRYTGRLSADGNTITGYWEMCRDGQNWHKDFDLVLTRVT